MVVRSCRFAVGQMAVSCEKATRVEVAGRYRIVHSSLACLVTCVSWLPELIVSVMNTVTIESKYLRLRFAVTVGSLLDEWKVIWVGGWDKNHVFYLALVERCDLSPRPGKT